ncbi:ankyrin repeat domain-containing protein [Gemmatimonadota bacterium]
MSVAFRCVPLNFPLNSLLFWVLLSCTLLGGTLVACTDRDDPASQVLEASRAGEISRVRALLDANPELLHLTDGDGLTPLHHAVLGSHAELAESLLDLGADISAVDAETRTPLHLAANAGDASLVDLLLARGADVMAREFRGRTPLLMATNWGNSLEVVEALIAAGADVNDRTEGGEEILFSTLYYGLPEIIEALLAAGARLPEDDGSVVRAAYLSASNGFEGVFRMAAGMAEARGLNWWEDVPMHAAARGGSVLIGETLAERGSAVEEKNLYGITPLHIAAENGRLAFVEFLVQSGASLEEPSVMGRTALHFAREAGQDSVAGRLLALGAFDEPAVFPELSGPYLGQPEPGDAPARFAPGIVSGHGFNSEHSPAAFSPDGTEVYWTRAFRGPIPFSRIENGRWTAPRPAPFLSEYGDGEPIFTPDGQRLYFLSQRPLEEGAEPGKENIWYVEREGDDWSEPRPVDAVVNEFDHHWLFSLSGNGTLFFSSVRVGGLGGRDIYRSEMVNGVHQPPENLGPAINTDGHEHTPFIGPDGSYLIFASTSHGTHEGMFHFLISYREPGGGWSSPMALDHITTPVENPLCPIITADGRFMFFIGSGDIWWTRADFIEEMRDEGRR